MEICGLTYTLEGGAQERFISLAECYKRLNGWSKKDILQFAINATSETDIEIKLQFLEKHISQLERESQKQSEEKSVNRIYISEDERLKCRKVAAVYAEELDKEGILVVEAGRYGFVKLQYYKQPFGFCDAVTFNNSVVLFNDLWEEWIESQLLLLTKDTPMAEMDYEDMFKCLTSDKQREFMEKRKYFAQRAEIGISIVGTAVVE